MRVPRTPRASSSWAWCRCCARRTRETPCLRQVSWTCSRSSRMKSSKTEWSMKRVKRRRPATSRWLDPSTVSTKPSLTKKEKSLKTIGWAWLILSKKKKAPSSRSNLKYLTTSSRSISKSPISTYRWKIWSRALIWKLWKVPKNTVAWLIRLSSPSCNRNPRVQSTLSSVDSDQFRSLILTIRCPRC